MAVFDKNNIMIPADQARVRAQEMAILQGPDDPSWKAVQIENLYASYGAVQGTFEMASTARERESRAEYSSSGSYSDDDGSSFTFLKWMIYIVIFFFIYNKLFASNFPEAEKVVSHTVSFILSWVQYGLQLLAHAAGVDGTPILPIKW
jgi:hypothetical protein